MSGIFKYITEKITTFFSSVIKLRPIDYNKGKTDPSKYYNNKLPNIYSNLSLSGKFMDPYFPNNLESITSKNNPLINYNEFLKSDDKDTRETWEKNFKQRDDDIKEYEYYLKEGYIRWERISNILKANKKTIKLKKDIKVKIAQSGLGDCYLISFLRGFLKAQPEKYYKLLGQCHPEIGYYEINFFSNNNEDKNITVFVDDYILLTKDSEPLFAGIREENKFVVGISLLIEKAYAKLNGSYLNIEGNFQPLNPHCFFTGVPSEDYYLNQFENNELYSFIDKELSKKNVLTTGTIDVEEGENFPISGISENHEYSVISVEKEKEINIIDINNPWGYNIEEKMNKFDIKLDDEKIKMKIVNFNKSKSNLENGNIKLDFGNLINYFETITLCPFRNNENERKKNGLKKKVPNGFPSNGFDDGTIDDINRRKKGIFDSLNIDEVSQKKFFNKFKNYKELGLYIIFSLFMDLGARREVFYKLIEVIEGMNNDYNSSQSQENFSQQMFNLLNSFPKYFEVVNNS